MIGIIHKPRGQLREEGGWLNDHFITLALFSKSDHERGFYAQKFYHVVYE